MKGVVLAKKESVFGTDPSPPVLAETKLEVTLTGEFEGTLSELLRCKSPIPEGVSIFHRPKGQIFKKHYTVAYAVMENGEGVLYISAGISYCSKKDQFCRATGRAYAVARLLSLERNIKHKVSFWVIRPYPTTGIEWRAIEELIKKGLKL